MVGNLVPNYFATGGEGGVVSYDFYDLFAKTGYKTFYGIKVRAGNAYVYSLLSDNSTASTLTDLDSVYGMSHTIFTNTAADMDFDMDITQAITLKGDAFIEIPYMFWTTGAATTFSSDMTIKIYKVAVGGAETQLGSTATSTAARTVNITEIFGTFSARVTIPLTALSAGEKIRMTLTATATGDANKSILIFHDPANYYTGAEVENTQMKVILPFRIDL